MSIHPGDLLVVTEFRYFNTLFQNPFFLEVGDHIIFIQEGETVYPPIGDSPATSYPKYQFLQVKTGKCFWLDGVDTRSLEQAVKKVREQNGEISSWGHAYWIFQ